MISNQIEGLKQIWQFDNCWQLILQRLFFRKTPLYVYRLGNLEFLVDHAGGDAVGVRDTIVSKVYRNLLQKVSFSASLSLIDLGANGGGVPLLLRSMGFGIERMICVEMNPNTFARLEFNLKRNFECRFQAMQTAVCGKRKIFKVLLGRGSTSDSIYPLFNTDEGSSNRQKEYDIEGVTFDEVFQSFFDPVKDWVDLVKIDIEGAEYELFSNEGHDCIRRCRYLLMEIHSAPTGMEKNEILDHLNFLDFECVASDSRTSVYLFANRLHC